jgi:hypothetical protein
MWSSRLIAALFLADVSAMQTTLLLGAFLMIATTAVDIGKAVVFFPILERHGKRHRRRLPGLDRSTVTANAVHPGIVSTSFGADDPGRTQRLLVPVLRPFTKSADRGAATSIHLASARQLQDVTGHYFTNRQPRTSSSRSRDQGAAARLWQASTRLVRC